MKWKKLALASVILGTIAGIAAPFTFDLYVFHASSAYSGRDFILRFSSPPTEEDFLDAVIRSEPLIEDPEEEIRQWRKAISDGMALKIKIDDRKCLALKPFDPCDSPDTVFADGTRIPGVWLTQPSTGKQVPVSLLVLGYLGVSFILVALLSFIILGIISFICRLLGVVFNRFKESKEQKSEEQKTEKNLMDYHYDCVKPEDIERRNKVISDRWRELHGFYTKYADEITKYLFYVNAGGAGAVLSFMGTSEAVRKLLLVRISLCCFAVGLICIGILRTILTHMAKSFFDNWKKDVASYYATKISFTQLDQNDNTRTESEMWLYISGYFSGASFIAGIICGGISLFS